MSKSDRTNESDISRRALIRGGAGIAAAAFLGGAVPSETAMAASAAEVPRRVVS